MQLGLSAVRWYLEIEGITEGVFKEASGFEARRDVIEYRAAGKGGQILVQKLPGNLVWSNIVLRRSVTADRSLWDWWQETDKGNVLAARRNGILTCYGPDNLPLARYSFRSGWVCRYQGPNVDASDSEVLIEEIEICHEGLDRFDE